MNILPKKSWHVRNKDNVAKVRRDEAQAAEEERQIQKRIERAEQEARTQFLRNKSRAALEESGVASEEITPGGEGGRADLELLNLFPLEDAASKKGNEEYLKEKKEEKEKQERAIGLLVSLGPQPGTEAPWYLKSRSEREQQKEEEKKKEKKDNGKEKDRWKRRSYTQEEKEKKDKRLKDSMDPLADMKKALAKKGHKDKKSKKKEKRHREEGSSAGPSSIEKLRAERLQREAEEKRRAKALLDQRSGGGAKEKQPERVVMERDRPYNSAYFPELARKRQKRDIDFSEFYK
ncbi:leukocyte receptor cluster member 1 [Engraulis encrasicolus]|uniref:leukocyte receptor cluster member 1 n=1 Tax=Engraulis encrasicolus TaxID=184585 RepID=UPI002FCE8FD0